MHRRGRGGSSIRDRRTSGPIVIVQAAWPVRSPHIPVQRLSVSFERVLEDGVRQPLYRVEDVSAAVAPVGLHGEYAQRLETKMLHISRRGGLAELADAVYTVDDASDKGRGRKRQVRLVGEWGIEVLIAHLADAGTADQELASYRAAAGFLESASRDPRGAPHESLQTRAVVEQACKLINTAVQNGFGRDDLHSVIAAQGDLSLASRAALFGALLVRPNAGRLKSPGSETLSRCDERAIKAQVQELLISEWGKDTLTQLLSKAAQVSALVRTVWRRTSEL